MPTLAFTHILPVQCFCSLSNASVTGLQQRSPMTLVSPFSLMSPASRIMCLQMIFPYTCWLSKSSRATRIWLAVGTWHWSRSEKERNILAKKVACLSRRPVSYIKLHIFDRNFQWDKTNNSMVTGAVISTQDGIQWRKDEDKAIFPFQEDACGWGNKEW